MYLRAQGLRGSDAYRTLQLAPNAPHELIVEVYWALVSRRRQGDAHGGDLDAAYALLMEEHARGDSAGPALSDARDVGGHYEVLCVDPSADAGIIDAAYSFLARSRQRIKRPRWQAIEDAYRILANPKLRAQHDMSLAGAAVPSADDSPPVRASGAPSAAKPPRGRGLFGRGDRTPVADAVEQRLLGLRGAAVASLPEPAPTPAPEPLRSANAVAEMVFVAGPQAGLRVPLDGAAVSMGADPRHHVLLDGLSGDDGVHIWVHGDRFMLRPNGVGAVLVEGRKLDLPVMAMDDGDEIAFAAHRVRFRRIAPA